MYFPDLSPYTYNSKGKFTDVVNVGWLDGPSPWKSEPPHPFPTGPTPQAAIDRLFEFCLTQVHGTRGWYGSPFTPRHKYGYPAERAGKTVLLGDAEVWVKSTSGRIYAAPNLIYHYIKDVSYLPPEEYLVALSDPGSRAITHEELDLPETHALRRYRPSS